MTTFANEQIWFLLRLIDANRDQLERVLRTIRPGNMQHDKNSLIRLILCEATADITGQSPSYIKVVTDFRDKLCEERLAEWCWFDMVPPEERD